MDERVVSAPAASGRSQLDGPNESAPFEVVGQGGDAPHGQAGELSIGFALTVVTIQLVPVLADAVGWRSAFWLLVPGPVVGALAMGAFGRERARLAVANA